MKKEWVLCHCDFDLLPKVKTNSINKKHTRTLCYTSLIKCTQTKIARRKRNARGSKATDKPCCDEKKRLVIDNYEEKVDIMSL